MGLLKDIIYIDESSVSSLQKRKHYYNKLGKICIIKTSSQEVLKKYTSIFSILTEVFLGWDLYDKDGIDSNRLYNFL